MGLGLGLGYLQTGQFLDHLAVIKIQYLKNIIQMKYTFHALLNTNTLYFRFVITFSVTTIFIIMVNNNHHHGHQEKEKVGCGDISWAA